MTNKGILAAVSSALLFGAGTPLAKLLLHHVSPGLSKNYTDDHEMLKHGMVIYDALYAWSKDCQKEKHNWPPEI